MTRRWAPEIRLTLRGTTASIMTDLICFELYVIESSRKTFWIDWKKNCVINDYVALKGVHNMHTAYQIGRTMNTFSVFILEILVLFFCA